jgi:hypothetical protein
MYHEFFSGHGLLYLPILSMALFMIVFAVLVYRALRSGGDTHPVHLPLSDDQEQP